MQNENRNFMHLYWALFAGALLLVASLLLKFAFPFIIGLIITYSIKPVYDLIKKYVPNNSVASLITTAWMLFSLIGLCYIVVPDIAQNIYLAIKYLPQHIADYSQNDHIQGILDKLLNKYLGGKNLNLTPYLSQGVNLALTFLFQLISFNFNLISIVVISPFVVFFGLRDWDAMVKSIENWIPASQKTYYTEITTLINNGLTSYISGQLLISLIMVIYYTITLLCANFHQSITLGIFSGIISFLPYAGCIGGFLLSTIVGLTQYGFTYQLWPLLVIYGIGYIIEIYILAPRLGKQVGLHTIWVFLALFIGIQINGLFGLFISIPSAIVINITIRYLLHKFKQCGVYQQ